MKRENDSERGNGGPPAPEEPTPPSQPPPRRRIGMSRSDRVFLRFLMFAGVVACLYLARPFALMMVIAAMAALALSPIVRGLCHWGLPRMVTSIIVVVMLVAGLAFATSRLVIPLTGWIERAPQELERIDEVISSIKEGFRELSETSEKLGEMADVDGGDEVIVSVKESSLPSLVLDQTPVVLGAVIGMVVLIFFSLAYGDVLLNKMVGVMGDLERKKRLVGAVHQIERRVSLYLVTVTIINLCLGICVGVSLYLLDFPYPWIFGGAAAALNFVPYVGSIVGVAILALFSLLNYPENLWLTALYPGVYASWTMLEGNFVTPTILGKSFALNPLAIIVSLLFFGWLWGPIGTLLAAPLMVILKTVGEYAGFKGWAAIISD